MKFNDEIVNEFRGILKELFDERIKTAKNEAYKEFANKLCEGKVSNDKTVIEVKVLLKEMVGDNGGNT